MFRLKACGHCRGDLWFGRDLDGAGWRCLQCGREAHSAGRAGTMRDGSGSLVSRRRGGVRQGMR
jgi:hypothetical protein